jgi:hypothetical protein
MTFTRKHFRHVCATAGAVLALSVVAPGVAADAATPVTSAGSYVPGRLYDVAAHSASDVWAVGLDPSGSLIMHWNGTAWTSSSEPGFLEGVAVTSPDNAWAVGGSNWFDPNATVVYHWNGSDWGRQPSPNPPSGGTLNGVAAASASNAWAVGQTGPGPGEGTAPSDRTLIEHWNGTAWTTVPSPTPTTTGSLTRVAVVSPSDAWAVGWTSPGSGTNALTEHWNGTAWTVVPVPASAGTGIQLNAVTAISARDAWAVGTTTTGPALHGVILHWNGTTWKRAATPANQPDGYLFGVSASSASNIWAVGQSNSHNCNPGCYTIIEHWNGCMWTVVPSPNRAYLNVLEGVTIISRDNAWAVGTTDYSNTLVLHWNGTSWS